MEHLQYTLYTLSDPKSKSEQAKILDLNFSHGHLLIDAIERQYFQNNTLPHSYVNNIQ